jgi:hypothetical protein
MLHRTILHRTIMHQFGALVMWGLCLNGITPI